MGSGKEIPIDVRLICATNQNLNKMVEDGIFREDLMYRINTVQIHLPSLRKREGDIILLADYYLKNFTSKYHKSNLKFNAKVTSVRIFIRS